MKAVILIITLSFPIKNLIASDVSKILENEIKTIDINLPLVSPTIDANKNSSEVKDPLVYLPINKKVIFEYSYESTNFTGKKKIVVEFLDYKNNTANARIIYYNKDNTKVIDYTLTLTETGIIASDSILGGKRTEIPIPLFKDKRWTENGNENRVIGFSSKVETPSGTYINCLKILTKIKESLGKRERFYAEGIGLVKEIIKFEDKTDIISLERYEVK